MENAKTTKKNLPDMSRDMNTKESAVTPTTALRKAWSWNAQRVLLFKGRFNPRQNPGAVPSMNTAVTSGMKLRMKERYSPRTANAPATASVSKTAAAGKANFSILVFVIGKSGLHLAPILFI